MVQKRSRTILSQWIRLLKLRILHTSDSPHHIALGVLLGLFVAWSPAFGLHMLLALTLCIVFRANKLVAIIFVWVCNPFTIIPIYYPSYLLGRMVMKLFRYNSGTQLSSTQVYQLFEQFTLSSAFTRLHSISFWHNLFSFLWHKGLELWIGATLMGLFVGLIGYVLTFYIVVWYRKKNPRRRFQIGSNS